MDQIKWLVVRPLLAGIVELERYIGEVDMRESSIENTKIRGENRSPRIHATHFNGPVARPGTDVQDSRRILGKRDGGQIAVEQDEIDLVDDVQTGVLGLVIRHIVGTVAIPPVILDDKIDILGLERFSRFSEQFN